METSFCLVVFTHSGPGLLLKHILLFEDETQTKCGDDMQRRRKAVRLGGFDGGLFDAEVCN